MFKKLLLVVLVWFVLVGLYQVNKSLPQDVSFKGDVHMLESSDVYFFQDRTYVDADEKRFSDQEIFDEIFRMLKDANTYILVDMFFYSNFIGVETSSYRQLSRELTDILVQKKLDNPDIVIQVITDPINVMYGGHVSDDFETLRNSGIPVIVTKLEPLRDSNPLYSSLWRTAFQWFGNSDKEGYLPNPLDESSPDLGLRTYLKMLNYKANHRKIVLTDYDRSGEVGFSTLITSGNPHDGSSAHSNMAMRIDSNIWKDVLATESTVAKFSGTDFIFPDETFVERVTESLSGQISTQLVTEGKIKKRIIEEIGKTNKDDTIDIAMFYISDRDVVKALRKADDRDVKIRMILDANKDAFGREKNGTPNRQVAHELVSNSGGNTEIRWCDTHGEQCHSKLLFIKSSDRVTVIQGSANYTKRNLGDYNLETNVVVSGPVDEKVFVEISDFFEDQWSNEENKFYSTSYEVYEDTSLYKTIMYRIKEFTGLSRW